MKRLILPFAWKDRPSLIEVAFPAQKVSIEAQCERKANAGQTLTALGSYWKGRKPLVLVRATILGALLPATDDHEKDLEIFELLMAMDDVAFEHRAKKVSPEDVAKFAGELKEQLLDEQGRAKRLPLEQRRSLWGQVLARMPYSERLDRRSLRPEELPESAYEEIWDRVNAHLGTSARSHAELVEQMGILRFGRRPRVGDTFCGAGSIPFEAARLGCDVLASDLNPIACMLTWGAFHIIGAPPETRAAIADAQRQIAEAVDRELTRLQIEHDSEGNRAKAYLYCLEARCPETGWMIPLSASWVVSLNRRCVAQLVPDRERRRFDIIIKEDATDEDIARARVGTVRDGQMVYALDGQDHVTPIRTLRGDRRVGEETLNDLRRWERTDFKSRPDDVFQERLFCVQWMKKGRTKDTYFRGVGEDDLAREARVETMVARNLSDWQESGLVPDMPIEPGEKTDEPIRTRGWTHWHHLFTPRNLLINALVIEARNTLAKDFAQGALGFATNSLVDRSARLSRWEVGFPGRPGVAPSADAVKPVFYNQALNTLYLYGSRSFLHLRGAFDGEDFASANLPQRTSAAVKTQPAANISVETDLFITDPPYADAVAYDEITEFFIAWHRKNPPAPFRDWIWDSRRALAIKGKGDDFRREMVKAYAAMAAHMPDNGLQVVMFTHQDTGVWADMAGIFWGAGLQVKAAWYIATETTSELKKGGYVQGTVLLVLRKRQGSESIYKDELVLEIRAEVERQIRTLVGLDQNARAHGRSENLFEDVDLQMAGYAAALRVLTAYTQIEGVDMTREALRPRLAGAAPSLVDEIIEFAVQVANEQLVPDGLPEKVWERLCGSERFYLRMLDVEAAGAKKLDNYQNFAKAFRVASWQPLMASTKPNDARLKSALDLKRAEFSGSEFGDSMLRALLFALYELQAELEPDDVMSHLRDNFRAYYNRREDVGLVATYLAAKLERRRPEEASAARVLAGLVRNEKLGA
jgi:adenine-specific DNA methylase